MYYEMNGVMSGPCTASFLRAWGSSCTVQIIQVLTAVYHHFLAMDNSNLYTDGDDCLLCGWLGT